MPSAYIILLVIALGAIWIYSRTSEDIPFVIASLTALVCFIWGFSCAPWMVQLIIVALVFRLFKSYLPDGPGLS